MARSETANVKRQVEDKVGELSGNGQADGLGKKLLVPAAAGLGTLAATYAARKGPELLRDRVTRPAQKLQGQGGAVGAIAEKAADKLGGGSREKTRRLPIQGWTDVAAPIDVVYQKWTRFDEYPKFMHRVLDVEKKDRNKVGWTEKIWFSTRRWEGEITARRKNDRIAWKTVTGTSHSGVVTFHKLDTSLTRVMVDMDFHPSGMIEKVASGLRFVKRAVEADLARFKAYVELGEVPGLEYTQEATTDESGQSGESKTDGGEGRDEDREGGREAREQRRA